MNGLLTNLIPPEIKLAKISRLKLIFKRSYLSILDGFQQMRAQNFKLEVLEVKYSYILLIYVTNFKLRLISFVYFFETTATFA